MFKIPKKIKERIVTGINRYQKIVRTAKAKDVNEADTVSVIKGILEEAFGWDRFTEITSEYAIRGTYCDLAIKVEDSIKYLIEVKAAGIELKESHMRQTIQYGASLGMPWVVLTNGSQWRIYKIKFEKPLTHDLVVEFDFVSTSQSSQSRPQYLAILVNPKILMGSRKGAGARNVLNLKSLLLSCLLALCQVFVSRVFLTLLSSHTLLLRPQ